MYRAITLYSETQGMYHSRPRAVASVQDPPGHATDAGGGRARGPVPSGVPSRGHPAQRGDASLATARPRHEIYLEPSFYNGT